VSPDERIDKLQEQIVTLRLQLDQQAHGNAALIDHAAQRAIAAQLGGRALTEAERDWVRASSANATERKRVRAAIWLHILQWGIGGAIGFAALSLWESFKAKVQGP
jgi:hypothetical protein